LALETDSLTDFITLSYAPWLLSQYGLQLLVHGLHFGFSVPMGNIHFDWTSC